MPAAVSTKASVLEHGAADQKGAEQRLVSMAMFSWLEEQFMNESGRKLSALFISSEKTFLYAQIKQCVIFVSEMDEWMVQSKGRF